MMKKKICLLISLFTATTIACNDSYKSNIPDAAVSLVCNLITDFSPITTYGQFVTVARTSTGYLISYPGQPDKAVNTQKAQMSRLGYAGLIIGNSTYNGYCAFDIACPVEANAKTTLVLKKDGLGIAVCPKCGTEYSLNNGGIPEKGEGRERLKTYRVFANATNTELSVSN